MPKYPMPLVRVEIVLQTLIQSRLSTLLIRRAEDPFKGLWALPGGVIRVDLDASLDASALRVLQERLHIAPDGLRQLTAIGSSGRDPRAPHAWGLSIVYRGMVPEGTVLPKAGKRIDEWSWFPVDELPAARRFAFDHGALVEQATLDTRTEFYDLHFPPGLIPPKFTLTELQKICEDVLGHRIDKSSFRRKLMDREIVTPIAGAIQSGLRNRPAALYSLSKI